MQEVVINWWAVLVALPINLALGALWYSPIGFGNAWMRRLGKRPEDFTGGQAAAVGYSAATVGAFLLAWVFATTLKFAETQNALEGMLGGFFLWLGFVVGVMGVNDFMERRPKSLWAINASFWLVVLLSYGALFGAWT